MGEIKQHDLTTETPAAPNGFTSSQIEASAKGVSSGELAFAEKAKEIAGALKADTAEGYAVAADFAKGVKAQIKRLDDLRKEMKRPLKESGDKIDAYFKPPIEAYRRAEDAVKHTMIAARATKAKALTASAGAVSEESPALLAPVVDLTAEGVAVRTRRVIRVVDESKVPRELCSPDEKKIGACLDLYPALAGDAVTLAGMGLEVSYEESLAISKGAT